MISQSDYVTNHVQRATVRHQKPCVANLNTLVKRVWPLDSLLNDCPLRLHGSTSKFRPLEFRLWAAFADYLPR